MRASYEAHVDFGLLSSSVVSSVSDLDCSLFRTG